MNNKIPLWFWIIFRSWGWETKYYISKNVLIVLIAQCIPKSFGSCEPETVDENQMFLRNIFYILLMNIHTPITEIKIYHVFNFPMCSTPWYFSNLFCSVFFFLKFWSWPASQPTTESPPAVWTALSHSEERQGQDSNQVITALGPDLLAERMSGKTETLEAWGQVRTLPMRGAAVQSLSCVRLCDPKDCSSPASSVLHYLPEFAQTHIHWGEQSPR